jgi:hypothetical protein
MRWRVPAALAMAALLGACSPGESPGSADAGSADAGSADATASARPVVSLTDVEAEPVETHEETVAVAFDRDSAAELVREVPDDVDFDRHALVCVFLGPRQTTGWSLDLRTATLSGDVLTIMAREAAPRTETEPEVTYPADCALLTRAGLPGGELQVRADDTITGEFIADAAIEVPAQ